MKRSNLEQGTDKSLSDVSTATAVVQVESRLSAVRGLRDGLVKLAMVLVKHREKRGYLLLLDPRLSFSCLHGEMEKVKAAMRPDIAHRLDAIVAKGGMIVEKPDGITAADGRFLAAWVAASEEPRATLPSPDKKEEVFRLILHQWITGQGPMTSRWIEDTVGCNYRTVSATVNRLGPVLRRHTNRRIELKHFPDDAWSRFVAVADKTRATMLYIDPSDQPRSPESLVQRLKRLGRGDIAVGGVLGAKRYDPDLDIVGTPRLDLCVHAPGKYVDLDFVQQLDPALERTQAPDRPARLALHFLRRETPLFEREQDGSLWADPVECLLDLYEARLESQAADFAEFLATRGRELSGES